MSRRSKPEDIARYFDENIDCCAPRRDPKKRPGVKLARLLEQQLRAAGLQGRTVLELGCGRGELSTELVGAGAARATGIDLSPDNIEVARRISSEDGLSDRMEFRVDNAATAQLGRHDIVVHHRVICCYPDPMGLLDNSIGVAGSVYGFSMPRSSGVVGLLVRVGLSFENLLHRVKRRGFRAYVHDERFVDETLRAAGFRLQGRSNRMGWFAAVYAK
ncbi:MAG: methyltransferase domain-containing protein [Actinomycetota bacterium]